MIPSPANEAKGATRTIRRRGMSRFTTRLPTPALLGLTQSHLDLHHLELLLGVEPLDVDLGRRYLALGIARTELADGLGLVGGLADRLPRLVQVARGVGE